MRWYTRYTGFSFFDCLRWITLHAILDQGDQVGLHRLKHDFHPIPRPKHISTLSPAVSTRHSQDFL